MLQNIIDLKKKSVLLFNMHSISRLPNEDYLNKNNKMLENNYWIIFLQRYAKNNCGSHILVDFSCFIFSFRYKKKSSYYIIRILINLLFIIYTKICFLWQELTMRHSLIIEKNKKCLHVRLNLIRLYMDDWTFGFFPRYKR